MAKAIGGLINDNLKGWTLVENVKQPISGERTIVWRGILDALDDALAYIREIYKNRYDNIDVDVDNEKSIATITLTASNDVDEATASTDSFTEDERKMPTVSIQGSMTSPHLYQHSQFAEISLKAIQLVDYLTKNKGYIIESDLDGLTDVEKIYARWKIYGQDTFLSPSYTMTITHYLKSRTKVNNFIQSAGTIVTHEVAVAKVPTTVRPVAFDDVSAWLVQAPSVSFSVDGITVSQSFVGAKKFPSFYGGDQSVSYDPPLLPTVDYSNDLPATSGQE